MGKTFKKIPSENRGKNIKKIKNKASKIKNHRPILKEVDIDDDISEYGDYVSYTIEDYTELNELQ